MYSRPCIALLSLRKQKRLATTDCQNSNADKTSSTNQDHKEFEPNSEVPGLSTDVLKIPDGRVGPGASKTGKYKNVEYFCYNPMSFYDANIELSKFRLPQPSALNPLYQPVSTDAEL